MEQLAIKFVPWEVPALEDLKDSTAYRLRQKLNEGGRLSREEKNWITEQVNRNSYFKSSVPVMGYRFDFSDVLRTFIVNQYGHYQRYNATDKTGLITMLQGRVDKIIESV
ncbi:MAG: molybdenum ABC transporter ATP-binding protein [Bacteroidota bacterium]|nr:molybdenum ABC transporter ATP-binding protein [Bacteroidota bacterium]MDP4268510.1 molybdenum ABC transporter ATP-binding protein [Bacteroidota bacterium]